MLEEGVTPTTSRIGLIRHGARGGAARSPPPGLEVIAAPVDLLREINIVDTPGTNAVRREHEALTREFVPRSDLVLFVTSADRPFTESERAFLQSIRDWGKKIVVVLNKVDIFERPGEVAEVVTFISDSARALLGFAPEVFPVSGRQALRAKQAGDAAALAAERLRPAGEVHRGHPGREGARPPEAAEPAGRRAAPARAAPRRRPRSASRC